MDQPFLPAMQAIYGGDLDELRRLLDAEPDLATRRSSCSHPTLLHMVAVDSGLGHVPEPQRATRVLLEFGANPQDAVLSAASTAALDVLDVLLEHGASLNAGEWRAVDECLYWGNTDAAQGIISRGAEAHRLRSAAGLGDIRAMSEMFDGNLPTPAAGPIASPFDRHVDPDQSRDPQHLIDHALVFAVLNGQRDAAQWLLDRGADPNRHPTGFHWGGTALHAAVWQGHVGLVHWLVEHGADPLVKDLEYGADALGWANHHGKDEIAALLMDHQPQSQ